MNANSAIIPAEHYSYTEMGRRCQKLLTQKTTRGLRRLITRYLPGLELRSVICGEQLIENLLVVMIEDVRILHWQTGKPQTIANNQVRYICANNSDSCTLETDAMAKIISAEIFYPYGGTAAWVTDSQAECSYKNLRYSGKERDMTGLIFYGWRYYISWQMRWLNPDPAGDIDGLNLWAMTANNPITFIDTNGQTYRDAQGVTHLTEQEAIALWSEQKGNRQLVKRQSKKWVERLVKQQLADGSFFIDKFIIDEGFRFVCVWPECRYKTNRETHYNDHLRTHSGEKPFRCHWPECEKAYSRKSTLNIHLRTHTQEKIHVCSWIGCDENFIHRGALNEHIAKHKNERNFKCPDCESRFNVKRGLIVHKKTVHAGQRSWQCREEGCDAKFTSQASLYSHTQRSHREHTFICPEEDCGAKRATASDLQQHMASHSSELTKPCRYDLCDAAYKSIRGRNRHERREHGKTCYDGRRR